MFPNLGLEKDKDGNEEQEVEIEVAMVSFAFDNSVIINWLKERGKAIKNEHWDWLDDVNDKIRLNLKKDSKLLDQIQRPCAVFVTMNSEEGYNRACHYN